MAQAFGRHYKLMLNLIEEFSHMSVTDEIKSRIDIVGYVQRHVPTLKKAGRNHKACCPFHNEKTPSFVVNPARQTWHCFGACAEGGDLFTFAQKLHGWSFNEALRELAIESGVQLRQQTQQEKTQNDRLDRLRDIVATASDIFHAKLYRSDAEPVLNYVREIRGLSDETVETFQLGFAPKVGTSRCGRCAISAIATTILLKWVWQCAMRRQSIRPLPQSPDDPDSR